MLTCRWCAWATEDKQRGWSQLAYHVQAAHCTQWAAIQRAKRRWDQQTGFWEQVGQTPPAPVRANWQIVC